MLKSIQVTLYRETPKNLHVVNSVMGLSWPQTWNSIGLGSRRYVLEFNQGKFYSYSKGLVWCGSIWLAHCQNYFFTLKQSVVYSQCHKSLVLGITILWQLCWNSWALLSVASVLTVANSAQAVNLPDCSQTWRWITRGKILD